jgi:hypothetical protein
MDFQSANAVGAATGPVNRLPTPSTLTRGFSANERRATTLAAGPRRPRGDGQTRWRGCVSCHPHCHSIYTEGRQPQARHNALAARSGPDYLRYYWETAATEARLTH